MKKSGWMRILLLVVALAGVAVVRHLAEQQESFGEPVPPPTQATRPPAAASPSAADAASAGDAAIESAFRNRRSDVWVESSGKVQKLLRDDNEGARHQLFILRLDSGQTVLVSHNIDLARRVPAQEGDRVSFRGEYEWNDRGGVVHWTHHDPQGRHAGGFLTHNGETYR